MKSELISVLWVRYVIALVGRRNSCCVCELALDKKHDLFFGEIFFCFSVSDVAALALIVDILIFSFNWWLYRVYILRSDSMRG